MAQSLRQASSEVTASSDIPLMSGSRTFRSLSQGAAVVRCRLLRQLGSGTFRSLRSSNQHKLLPQIWKILCEGTRGGSHEKDR